jgi:hypothetical protein
MRSTIRRIIYRIQGEPVTLAFVACIADQHPEHIDAPQPPPEPLAIERPSRQSRWSEKLTRRRDRDRERMTHALNQVGYEATVRRILAR